MIQALAKVPEAHVVELAAGTEMEFEDALRSVLRLAARREVIIKQRDPIANDHLVFARRRSAREAGS